MTAQITPIRSDVAIKTAEPYVPVVELLESWLAKAKAGQLRGIAMAGVNDLGGFDLGYQSEQGVALAGALGLLHHDYMYSILAQSVESE